MGLPLSVMLELIYLSYHWSLTIGPDSGSDSDSGVLFHAHQELEVMDNQLRSVWRFQERAIHMEPTNMILVRVLLGKIRKRDRVESLLRQIPVRGDIAGWNCVSWVMDALATLKRYQDSGSRMFGKHVLEWNAVRLSALHYVQYKRENHRFDGSAEPGTFDQRKVATWDILKDREKNP